MSKESYLQEQITRVRAFATWCGKYPQFAPLLTLMGNAKSDQYYEPLALQELWCFSFNVPSMTGWIRVGKIRTINWQQALLPGYEPVTNYTDTIYTMPSLIADEEVISKADFAIRLMDELDKVKDTGMERIMPNIKNQILIELLNPDVQFGGMDKGDILTWCGYNDSDKQTKYLQTRYGEFFRPEANRLLIVDGTVNEKFS